MLAQVITNNVGEMNAQLAQTESGKQQQLVNTLGDMKEQLGGMVNGALPFVTIAAHSTTALTSITTLVTGVKTLSTTLYASVKAFAASTVAMVKNKGAALATAAAQKIVSAATAAWTAVQKVLNLVLTMNPIGLIITAIGALVTALIAAYNNCEGFRQICDKVWEAIKPLATAIMNGLAKAFEWLVEKCKEAWEWLKNILGLGNKKVEVAVEVSKPKTAPGIDLGAAKDKYKDYKPTTTGTPTTPKVEAPVWTDNAETLKAITDNIQILQNKLQTASIQEAALINQQIADWKKKAEAIENAGNAAEDNTPLWKEDAATLKDIGDNIEILTAKLQTATVEEAALINQQIKAWNDKADAIKNAGKEAEKTAVTTGQALKDGRYNYIVNLTPEATFQNTTTQGNKAYMNSWRKKANAGDQFAADRLYKYQHRPAEELYDMIEDPWELNNLADDPQYAAKKAELRTAMEAWMADVGDLGQETEMKALERLWENAPAPDPGDPSEPAVGWVKVTSDRSDWSGNYLVVRDGVDYPRAWNLTAQNNNNIFVMVASNNAIKAAGTSQGGADIPLEELHDYTVNMVYPLPVLSNVTV